MKKSLFVLPFVLLFCVAVLFGFGKPLPKKINDAMNKKGFAVVELFTSEGCSSCPPADEAVAMLSKDYPANVYVLGFHVDYWNYLGWKDEFSSADNTSRQQEYASVLKLNSIYTPQVIVNGKTEFTGSDKKRLYVSVEESLSNNENALMELSAKATGTNDVAVSFKTGADNKSQLHIALVQLQTTSTVKRGENKGKQLHHIDVVRSFVSVAAGTGSSVVKLPAGLSAKDCKIIGFIQNNSTRIITGAGECAIQ